MMESEYAFLEARLLSVEKEIRFIRSTNEIINTVYRKIYELADYIPGGIRDFVEWWSICLDIEGIKGILVTTAGDWMGPRTSLLRMGRQQAQPIAKPDQKSLDTILRGYPEITAGLEGLGGLSYPEGAYAIDSQYFRAFNDKLPRGYGKDLATKLLSMKVDFLNSRLVGRMTAVERYMLPGGILGADRLKDRMSLTKGLREQYGVDSQKEIPRLGLNACNEEGTGFGRVMGLLVKWDPAWWHMAS